MSAAHETRLLVAVINDPEKLDEILSGFLELGITGATILNSEGMGSVLSHDIPIFAGLQTLLHGSRPQNRMIFSVVPLERVDPAVALLREVTGNLDAPATGIVFTLPIDRVEGLAPELGEPGSPI
jgi:nitrogen regulatory protein P-II 1